MCASAIFYCQVSFLKIRGKLYKSYIDAKARGSKLNLLEEKKKALNEAETKFLAVLPNCFLRRTGRTQLFANGLIKLPGLNIFSLNCTDPPGLCEKTGKLRDEFLTKWRKEE